MKKRIIALILGTMLIAAGCSGKNKNHDLESGLSFLEAQEYESAIDSLNTAIANHENDRQAYRGLGIAYLKENRYEEARESLLLSLSSGNGVVDDLDFDTNLYLADAYMGLSDYESAVDVYDSVIALRQDMSDAYFLRGIAYLGLQKHDEAIADFKKVTSLEPRNYDRMIQIYEALADNGYGEEGSSVLTKALESGSQYMTNYEKGQISYYLGNNADAQSYLEQARNERDTDKTPAVLLLGKTGEKQGDYNYAISVYKTYLAESPNHAEVYNQLGSCQIMAGDYQGAIDSFQAGIALEDAKYTQALRLNQITAYEYMGQFKQAAVMMGSFLQDYPDNEQAQREYIFLSTR